MSPFIAIKQIIPNSQYGYRKGIGIYHQNIDIQKVLFNGLNDKNVIAIDIVFLDLSNAFDTVPHDRLMYKLNRYGIEGLMYEIIKDNFDGITQIVVYNDILSQEIKVKSGVRQGGHLSPELFNIYTSDYPKIVKSKILC